MRHTTAKPNQHTFEFSSWHEFVDYADKTEPVDMMEPDRSSRHGRSQLKHESHSVVKYWGGYASFTQAVEKSAQGWPEGAAELTKTFSDFTIPQVRTQTQMAFSPVGPGTLAMGRYIQGHPESWMVQRETEILTDQITYSGGVVHLGINTSQSGGMSATARFQLGAVLLSLVDMLERNGKRVELTFFNSITGMNNAYCRIAVKVKQADSAVNMSILAAAFANVGTQRRLCFSIRETVELAARIDWGVMGEAGGYGTTDREWHTGDCTFIKGLDKDFRFDNPRIVQAWLKAQLTAQGIEWDGE